MIGSDATVCGLRRRRTGAVPGGEDRRATLRTVIGVVVCLSLVVCLLATAARARAEGSVASTGATAVALDDWAVLVALRQSGLQYTWHAQPSVVAASGACGTNQAFEAGSGGALYIEQQGCAEDVAIPALLDGDRASLAAALRAVEWGFKREAADGSFPGQADAFHSTIFFLVAAARTALLIAASPLAGEYAAQIATWSEPMLRAARYMARPDVLAAGRAGDAPFGHRRFLLGAGLGLVAAVTGDGELRRVSRESIAQGVALQRADGVIAELGGHDSHYQAYGMLYALLWLEHDGAAPQAATVTAVISRALAWERSRILATGEVLDQGNTRTAGQERNRDGSPKTIVLSFVIRALGSWGLIHDDQQLRTSAQLVLAFRNGHGAVVPPEGPAPTTRGGNEQKGQAQTIMGPSPTLGWRRDVTPGVVVGSPLIVDDRVVAIVGYARDPIDGLGRAAKVIVVDRRTGVLRWERWLGASGRADTPGAVVAVGGGRVLAATSTGDLQALDLVTGQPLWSRTTGIAFSAAPSSYNGVFVLTGVASGGVAGYGSGPGVWAITHGGVLAWQYHDGVLGGRGAAVTGTRVFASGPGGQAVALDLATGARIWRRDLGARGPGGEAPASHAGRLWVGDGKGSMVVLDDASGAVVRVIAGAGGVPPTLSGQTVYLYVAQATGVAVQARSIATDQVLWTHPLPAPAAVAPLYVGGTVVIATTGGDLLVLAATSGAERSRRSLGAAPSATTGMNAALHTLLVPLGSTMAAYA